MVVVEALSRVLLFATPWPVAHQAPLSMAFPRQEYWTRLPFPSPGDLPNPGREPSPLASPALQADYKGLPGKPIRSLNDFKQYGAILQRELLRQSQSEGEAER